MNSRLGELALRKSPGYAASLLVVVGLTLFWLETAEAQAPASVPGGEATASAAMEERAWLIHAALNEEYRVRGSSVPSESDQRLRLFLDGGAVDPSGHYLADVNIDFWWRLSRRPGDPTLPFGLAAIHDYQDPWFAVYQLTGEYTGTGLLQTVRLGRQEAPHGRPGTFDGAYLLAAPTSRLSLFAFGGRSEHFFDIGGAFENWLASAGGTIGITPNLKLEVDYRFLREVVEKDHPLVAWQSIQVPLFGHSYGLAGWWRRGEWLRVRLAVRGLNDVLSEVSTTGQAFWQRLNLGVNASVYFQPRMLGEINEADNPYFLTLGPSLSHARWKLDIYKVFRLGPGSWETHLGYAGRQLLYSDARPFNRNVWRIYGLLGTKDLPLKGLSANVSVESVSWPIKRKADQWHIAVNGAVGYERSRIQVETGSQYHRYQYTYYQTAEEIADVRSVYADIRVKIVRWLSARILYRLEIFPRGPSASYPALVDESPVGYRALHTVILGLTQSYDREPSKQVPR